MADTIPNIVVPPNTVVDLYAETGIAIGTEISIVMIGNGNAKLFAGATLSSEPTDSTGYCPIYERETAVNDVTDLGAFIWSRVGCTVNIKEV